ncbi:hypothetical protein DL769_003634 [Monosporascus sp. CRB-8-3]|nr:hypothetical protein DL769_003634 [Monosporascus sp. CRB-8-3]
MPCTSGTTAQLQCIQKGGPFKIAHVPKPTLLPDQVLIRQRIIALNLVDFKQRETGLMIKEWPHVLGLEGAGVLEAVGADVRDLKPGDEVMAWEGSGASEPTFGGAYQERVALPASLVGRKPRNISLEEAASIPTCYVTAVCSIVDSLKIPLPFIECLKAEGQAPTSILVLGGSSAVGSAAIQLLRKAHPSLPILATSSPKHHQMVKDLGATYVMDYKSSSVVSDINAASPNAVGVDMILDCVAAGANQTDICDTLDSGGPKRYAGVITGQKIPVPPGVNFVDASALSMWTMPGGLELIPSLTALVEEGKYRVPLPVRVLAHGLEELPKVMDEIQRASADINAQGEIYGNALQAALAKGHFGLAKILIEKDADINAQGRIFGNALQAASSQGHDEIVRTLIDKGADVNLQDGQGTTALMKSICRDLFSILSILINNGGTDPLIKDIRGRDALYWAARMASIDTFKMILQVVEARRATPSVYQHAISAAAAADKCELAELLLEKIRYKYRQTDEDGWTALYTAQMYHRPRIVSLIEDAFRDTGRHPRESMPALRPPSRWHSTDMAAGVLESDGKTITVRPEAASIPVGDIYGIVRTDHPMVPRHNSIYYFEVVIEKGAGDSCEFSIGFCEENMQLDDMLGCGNGSWGYICNTGNRSNQRTYDWPYGPTFGEGSTIGCGVNFTENSAFYTKDGEIIGYGTRYPVTDWATADRLEPRPNGITGLNGADVTGLSSTDWSNNNNALGFFATKRMAPPKVVMPADVRQEAKDRPRSIFANYELLRHILERHEATIQKRWEKKTRKQRLTILAELWPGMPTTHRPDFGFRKNAGRLDDAAVQHRGSFIWPYINQEDLAKAKTLPLLLNAYGKTMASSQFPLGEGLLILECQDRLLEFLIRCCRKVLHDIPLPDLVSNAYAVQPELLFNTNSDKTDFTSLTKLAEKAPYRPPAELDLKKIESLLAARAARAEDHIWTLREDPGYFADQLLKMKEHREDVIKSEFAERTGTKYLARVQEALLDKNIISICQFRDPSDCKFEYPIGKRRNHANVEKLRKAEAHLDVFWAKADELIHTRAGKLTGTTLERLLSQPRPLQRTPEWVESTAKNVKKQGHDLTAEVNTLEKPFSPFLFSPEPPSRWTEALAAGAGKIKTKIRGTPNSLVVGNGVEDTTESLTNSKTNPNDRQSTFLVNARA